MFLAANEKDSKIYSSQGKDVRSREGDNGFGSLSARSFWREVVHIRSDIRWKKVIKRRSGPLILLSGHYVFSPGRTEYLAR